MTEKNMGKTRKSRTITAHQPQITSNKTHRYTSDDYKIRVYITVQKGFIERCAARSMSPH